MVVTFGSKSDTLEALRNRLTHAKVLPQVRFTIDEWRCDSNRVLEHLAGDDCLSHPVIVRSSAVGEDDPDVAFAGRFRSVADVTGRPALVDAIAKVIASFPNDGRPHQVFVQPFLNNVACAGVAFGQDPNSGGPYIIVNYDDQSGRTDLVTGGRGRGTRTYVESWTAPRRDHPLAAVVLLVRELAALLGTSWLDVEFAIDRGGVLYLLQVRPLPSTARNGPAARLPHSDSLDLIARRIEEANRRHPYLSGARTVFGIMPDWNPAEIIGIRPRPLALSLYRELVTDNIWAYQRYKYGYRDVRSFPLVVDFEGLPYVDVRVSFNSFVPRDVKPPIADRLVDYYIDKLIAAPVLHDKVEFDIVFSCYTPDLPMRLKVLEEHGFSPMDVGHVAEVLRRLTNRIMGRLDGLWQEDVERTRVLEHRRTAILASTLTRVDKLFWLVEDCKRFGTLPFAGLARCAFIATQILQSLLSLDVFDRNDYEAFMGSLDTISARMSRDLSGLPFEQFVARYGHLRPGTYDITSPRYDEAPERYFDRSRIGALRSAAPDFTLTNQQRLAIRTLLHEHGIDYDAESLLGFIRTSIEAREDAKFVFTKSLSDALILVREIGEDLGFGVDDLSFVPIGALREAVARTDPLGPALERAASDGRHRWEAAQRIVLPPLLVRADDVFAFHVPPTEPNFITQLAATGPIVDAERSLDVLAGSIVLIRSADPGWDWLLTRDIAAFITEYGGANSHMAVRAHQLGLPAVIGAGESLFETCRRANRLLVDCGNHQIQVLS